jgi:hypothetical protein
MAALCQRCIDCLRTTLSKEHNRPDSLMLGLLTLGATLITIGEGARLISGGFWHEY